MAFWVTIQDANDEEKTVVSYAASEVAVAGLATFCTCASLYIVFGYVKRQLQAAK